MDHELDAPAPTQRSHGFLLWLFLVGLAWFVVEITANPYLGPALAGLKFAWEDIRSAFWLRRTDPLPYRGRVAFWLYLTWALFKLFMAGILTTIFLAFLGITLDFFGVQPGLAQFANSAVCMGAVLTWTIAAVILPVMGLPVFWLARRRHLKLWVSSAVSASRKHGEWPPQGGSFNCFPYVALAVFLSLHVGPLALVFPVALATDDRDLVFTLFVAVMGTYVFVLSVGKVAPSLWSRIVDAFNPEMALSAAEFWDDR